MRFLIDVKNVEYDLYNNLFQNYSNSIRPVDNWNDKINVDVNVHLRKIADVVSISLLKIVSIYIYLLN